MPQDRMTVADAVAYLGLAEYTVLDYCHRGGVFGKIDFVLGKVPFGTGARDGGMQLSIKSVSAVHRKMYFDIGQSFTDKEGKWIPEPMAEREYDTTPRVLRYQNSRGRLNGQRIPFYIPKTTTKRGAIGWAWFYTQESLNSCFRHRRINGRVVGASMPSAARITPAATRGRPEQNQDLLDFANRARQEQPKPGYKQILKRFKIERPDHPIFDSKDPDTSFRVSRYRAKKNVTK
jgi:hypothetical protein